MRVNVYAEEITNRIEIVRAKRPTADFVGIRFYLELPVTQSTPGGFSKNLYRGPFERIDGDDDSAAVTFWALESDSRLLENMLREGLKALETRDLAPPDNG